MFGFLPKITDIIKQGAASAMTDKEFFEIEIARWKNSPERKAMLTGMRYYLGDHDILNRKRTVIGKDGVLQEVNNLPNNKIVDNQYSKIVDQKVNYLLGKPLTISVENKQYEKALKNIFNKKFHKMLKNIGEDVLNGGIAWLYPYYDSTGEFCFKHFAPYEILPFWADAAHTKLDLAIRLYEVITYEGRQQRVTEKVEIYSMNGIDRYILQNGTLIPDIENPSSSYLSVEDENGITAYNWGKIPLIAFKYNSKEIPLIKRVKSLQDSINTILSDFANNLQEDARNTILVIKNMDGANLAEFRHNLATYGAVKVKTVDGADGGVDTLTVNVNADNYKIILALLKTALIENARGFDAKDDRLSGNPNQMNIQSMYSDIDLDANGMEIEFQASLETLLWFINVHLANIGHGDFEGENVEIIFNRDMLMNESDVINNCQKSVGILSNETVISQHPWVSDVGKELRQIANERQIDEYSNAFGGGGGHDEE